MRELWPRLGEWMDEGTPFALATATHVEGSAPRVPGACMAIRPDAERFIGSVSSGCLDSEIVHAAREALVSGTPRRLRFGPDGSAPWVAGLTCGGWIDVTVEPWWGFSPRPEVREIASRVRTWVDEDRSGVVLSRGDGHLALESDGTAIGDATDFAADIIEAARRRLADEAPPIGVGPDEDCVFIRTIRRRPRLLMIGAVDIAARLVGPAREAGFATTIVDPRAAYVAAERFSVPPDRLVRAWPQATIDEAGLSPRDVAIVLTHDPKIDDAGLLALLGARVGYLGALGSARSHRERLERLREQGAESAALERIHGPAGIHLGTPDAAGIAVGILAGILRWQAEAERKTRETPLATTA